MYNKNKNLAPIKMFSSLKPRNLAMALTEEQCVGNDGKKATMFQSLPSYVKA